MWATIGEWSACIAIAAGILLCACGFIAIAYTVACILDELDQ